jgi:hypothetical protein
VQDRLDRSAVFRRADPALCHRTLEPVEVIGQPEEAVPEHMHDVVDDIGPRKTPIGDRQHSLGDRHEAATDIAGAIGELGSGHALSPGSGGGSGGESVYGSSEPATFSLRMSRAMRREEGESVSSVIARSACDEAIHLAARKIGLLRCARNDGVGCF